jgi:hypothetical protein
MADIEKEIDRLYGLPLEDFTRERNETAKRLRKEGERAKAARVQDLRKPTVSAWAINQLARKEKLLVRSLLSAVERVRKAQEKMLKGGSPDRLREASDVERKALDELVNRAERLLTEGGRESARSVRDRIDRTLRGAATEPEARDLLKRGRLTGDVDPSGFGTF